jgi:hypothetical protein
MKSRILFPLTLALATLPLGLRAAENTNKWSCDVTLYGLAAGMSGDVTVRGVPADLNVGFDDIVENLEFGAMGKIRLGYDRWAFTTDVVYMGLGASKNGVSMDFDQWVVEPSLSYRVTKSIELLAGARYNNLSGQITGPFGRIPSGTQEWWDPIVGADVGLPLGKSFRFNLRGDVGGFGVGSDVAWQVFPYVGWQFAAWGSLQAGYRWVYADYETGSGASLFRYDMLTQGAQIGVTFHF